MPTPRATKTTLSFGLVSCPIALYRATGEAEKPVWDRAGPNGGKLTLPGAAPSPAVKQEAHTDPLAENPDQAFAGNAESLAETYFIEEGTGAKVTPGEIRKGIRHGDGSFVDLTDGLEEITAATKLEEMRIVDFIRTEEIRRDRVTGSYYLAPDGPGAPQVVRLLHEAMRAEKRVAVVRFTKRTKQSLGVLVAAPESKSLMLIELAWAEDCREAPAQALVPSQVEVTPEEIAVAVELVQAMSGRRADSLDMLTDDARELRRDLIARAEAGEEFSVPERPEAQESGDVVELLHASARDPHVLAAAA